MEKYMTKARVSSQEMLSDGIYSLCLKTWQIADAAVPGQFVNLYSRQQARLLPRPISLCEIRREDSVIRLVYRVAGKGTEEFSQLSAGDEIELMGPLGNGFLEASGPAAPGAKVLLIGGGIGIPPMLALSRAIDADKSIVLGYRSDLFLTEDFRGEGKLYLSTEDGSHGTKGTVIDAIREHGIVADVIYACGPTPMLRAVKELAGQMGIPAWLSLEERMACGVGACLGCVVCTCEKDEHTGVNNTRVCADGPVFAASEVIL